MKILSVDDDQIILELLVEVLASIGQTEVTTAASAVDALEILKHESIPFDCFLLDIQMPEIDGIQLCSALRKSPLYHATPILMITTMSDKTHIDKAFAAGATDYVTKPFDVIELGARVRVVDSLVAARRNSIRNSPLVDKKKNNAPPEKTYSLEEKLQIKNIDGVIDYNALENYISLLSRGSMFGSKIMIFHISEIDRIFNGISEFDFISLITDVAEAITFCLNRSQFLTAYAGNGTFVCVYGRENKQSREALELELCDIIKSMDLCYSDGRPHIFTVVAYTPIKLSFRSRKNIPNILRNVCSSAESSVLAHIG